MFSIIDQVSSPHKIFFFVAKSHVISLHFFFQECTCDVGYISDAEKGCILKEEICHYDGDCPSQTACIGGECLNPCEVLEPCGVHSICKVLDTLPVRTSKILIYPLVEELLNCFYTSIVICECPPGYQGNAAIQCDKRKSNLNKILKNYNNLTQNFFFKN